RSPHPRAPLPLVERVRRVFDLGADPAVIAACLRRDPLLRGRLARHPGIRCPGAWDGSELVVRAILGQQISVRAATTLAGRIAARFGSAAAGGDGLDRLFPTPSQLASADLEGAGVMPARAETIRALGRDVAAGRIALGGTGDVNGVLAALRARPGIGEWTASYVAMRALGEPDAFPAGDRVLLRLAGEPNARALERRSEAWRPWRAYAVVLLWQGAVDDAQNAAAPAR